jgi:hypothetical protein
MDIPPFDKLPNELISRIFTIGCELDVHGEGGSWVQLLPDQLLDALLERDAPTPIPFAATSLSVCRRWNAIARARSNRHLWVIFATFSYQGCDNPPPGKSDLASLARFKSRLSLSNGCSIYVRYWGSEEQNGSELVLEIRFAVLFIALIRRHRPQIVSFWVNATYQITSLILRLLKNVGEHFHPHAIRISGHESDFSFSQTEFIKIASSASSLHSMELCPEEAQSNDGGDVTPLYLDIWYVDFDISDDAIPVAVSFIHGQLREIILSTICITLANLQQIMICCLFLRELEAQVAALPESDSSILGGPIIIRRRGITKLRLFVEDSEIMFWVLQSFELPQLRALRIGGDLPITYSVSEISFPSLQAIDPSDSISGVDSRHISSVRLSGLRDLDIGPVRWQDWDVFALLASESLSLDKLSLFLFADSYGAVVAPLDGSRPETKFQVSPSKLFLWGWDYPESFLRMLSAVNLAQTTHIETEILLNSVSFPNELNGWRFDTPLLSSLRIQADLLAQAVEFAGEFLPYLLCPCLQNVEVSSLTGPASVSISFEGDRGSNSTIGARGAPKMLRLEINVEGGTEDAACFQILYQIGCYGSIFGDATELRINFLQPNDPFRELLVIAVLLGELDIVGYRNLPNLKQIEVCISCGKTRLLSKSSVDSAGIQELVDERRRHGCPLEEFRIMVDTKTYLYQ